MSKTYTPPIEEKPLVDEEMSKISTQIEEIIEPTTEESSTPQPTENIEPTNTPTTETKSTLWVKATAILIKWLALWINGVTNCYMV